MGRNVPSMKELPLWCGDLLGVCSQCMLAVTRALAHLPTP